MSVQERQRILKLLVGLAEFYGQQLPAQRLILYAEVLQDLKADEVERAVRACLCDPEITRMPLPAALREKVRPSLSCRDAAQELVTRCYDAVRAFGSYNPEKAAEFLGDLVWNAIGREFGWARLCLSGDCTGLGADPIGVVRAQMRDAIESKLHVAYPSGRLPSLPPPGGGPKISLPKFDPVQTLRDEAAMREGELTSAEIEKEKARLREQLRVVAGEKTGEARERRPTPQGTPVRFVKILDSALAQAEKSANKKGKDEKATQVQR